MKTRLWKIILAVLFLLPVCTQATVLTFDDIGVATNASKPVPDGYGGFDWGKPGVFANDETFDLLDILAYTPFVFVERYYQFCLW